MSLLLPLPSPVSAMLPHTLLATSPPAEAKRPGHSTQKVLRTQLPGDQMGDHA